MARPFTAATIVKAIVAATKTPAEIELVKGPGYWYFIYTGYAASGRLVYDSNTIYSMYLHRPSFAQWVDWGTQFVERMEALRLEEETA